MPPSNRSRSLPAWPTNGSPCLSSWKPGASPTNMRSAFGSPTPNTTCVRVSASRHFVHCATWEANAASSVIRRPVYDRERTSVRAAARAAAAAAARGRLAEARLRLRAARSEHGELLRDVPGPAVGARRRLVAEPDELLEVALALHADVLVDRHRPQSTIARRRRCTRLAATTCRSTFRSSSRLRAP